jgi:IS30 family transposase
MSAATTDREKLRARAQRLRDRGSSYAEIASRLGFANHTTTWRLLNPERAAEIERGVNARRRSAKRAWENEQDRGTCPCGATLGVAARRLGTKVCAGCRDEMARTGRAMRRDRIRDLWLAGALTREIAVALGSTPNSIGGELVAMRREGWGVPARPPGSLRGPS